MYNNLDLFQPIFPILELDEDNFPTLLQTDFFDRIDEFKEQSPYQEVDPDMQISLNCDLEDSLSPSFLKTPYNSIEGYKRSHPDEYLDNEPSSIISKTRSDTEPYTSNIDFSKVAKKPRNHEHKKPFTAEEDALILDLHSKFGNNWGLIAKHFDGRDSRGVKNRYKKLNPEIKQDEKSKTESEINTKVLVSSQNIGNKTVLLNILSNQKIKFAESIEKIDRLIVMLRKDNNQ